MSKRYLPLIILILVIYNLWLTPVYAYRWPFQDSVCSHPINATLGEYRTGHLHNGVDTNPSTGAVTGTNATKIYAIAGSSSCTVSDVGTDNESVSCGGFSYVHVKALIQNGASVQADNIIAELKVLQSYPTHLHLTESSGGVNPLRIGGLDNFSDTTPPSINSISILRQGSGTSYPTEGGIPVIDGQTDIRANAKDSMSKGSSTGSSTVGLYRIGYKITNAGGTIVSETFKIQFDTTLNYSLSLIYDTSLSNNSNYEYWVTNRPTVNEYWDTTTVPDGTYTITVIAEDIGRPSVNRATRTQTVIVRNGVSCSYSISPTSNSFGSSGGTSSVSVTASSGCSWTASSNASWITITAGSSGSGNGTVSYSVSSNTGTSSRSGTLTIAGQTFTVTQSGVSCSYSISPTSNSFASSGGTGSVSVTATSGCSWTASSNASWITITSGGSGSGSGTVSYSVSSNTSTSSRTGTLNIAGQTFTVTQSGISCSYSISPTSNSIGSNGGTGSVSVTATSGCSWTASSNASWITITSGGSGSGSGTVSYSVSSNTSTSLRSGTLTIAGQTFTVTQSGISEPSATITAKSVTPSTITLGQSFTVSVTGKNNGGAAGWGGLSVSFPQMVSIGTCAGTSYSGSEATISGSTTLTSLEFYPKNCMIYGAGGSMSTQYLLAEASKSSWANNESQSMTLTVTPKTTGTFTVYVRMALCQASNCSSTQAISRDPASGSPTDQQGYAAYSFSVTVNQSCSYSISPTSNSFNSSGGTGSVSVTATSGCSWTALSNASWISITSGSSGTGSGTVSYSVSSNTSTSSRSGTLTIAGQTFTVSQSGVSDASPPTGSISINSGAAYTNSTSVTLSLSASDSSGVSQMCISNTTSCSSWETYSTSKSWSLTSGDGTKTVYAWFKDSVGNANTSPYSDSIILDTTAPTDGTLSASPGNGQILLSWSGFSDSLSNINSYKLVYSTSSVPSSCSAGTEIYSGPNTSYTHTGLINGTNYHYRICAIDNAGNSSTGKTAVATPEASDTTPPTGSITINSGASYVNSTSVTLTLFCTDASGCSQMQFSNDNTNWSTAEAYAASKIWTLSNGDGTKMVYVKFKDGAGNWSSAYSNSIILDTVAPANGALTATAGNTIVALIWSGFSDAASGIGSYKLVYGTSGSLSSCATGTQLYSDSGASYTHTGLSNGTTYYYRICATDNAGNISEGATTSAIPVAPDGVSIPPSDTGITGVEREDGGSDNNNLDSTTNKPRIDITYNFGIVIKDPSGSQPQYARLYMTQRSSPTPDDFYYVNLTCDSNWAYGAYCSYPTLLGPAANHKYYFEAKLADGIVLRNPATAPSDTIAGPSVELLNGYNMVSAPRDTIDAGLDGTSAFGSVSVYKWVSSGLTTDGNKGGYIPVDASNPVMPGEGYFIMKDGIMQLPELGIYTDILGASYTITLKSGWNMISNPYGGNVKLSAVQVQKGSGSPELWGIATANGWVVNAIYYYKGSDWGSAYTFESAGGSPDAILVPWMGYWVYLNKNDDTYKLVITRP